MKNLLNIIPYFICFNLLFVKNTFYAQNFTWVSGSNSPYTNISYGTPGIGSSLNTPGSRADGVSWKDKSGNLWLFGGIGYTTSGNNVGGLNDVWRLELNGYKWAWMKGSVSLNGTAVTGTKGVPATANTPGSNYNCVGATDTAGNFWLYSINLLWKYDVNSNEWTWVSGNTTTSNGIYGTKGVAAALNEPGPREYSQMWCDANNNLWIFGGYGYGSTGNSNSWLNDLWKYSISTNEWTWVSGSSVINQYGIYGSKGISAPANTPGGRVASTGWTDKTGNLWLFGGLGYDGVTGDTPSDLNDLWKFNTTTNEWTWMNGSNVISINGTYGTITVPSPLNSPGSRDGSRAWADSLGNGWIFGGFGMQQTGLSAGLINDLWRYDVKNNTWTWMKGATTILQNTVEGIQGVAAPGNIPSARRGIFTWTDLDGKLWFYGSRGNGSSLGFMNCLWKYDVCYPATVSAASPLNVCAQQSASLSVNGTNGSAWYSSLSGGTALYTGSVFVTPPLTANTTYYTEDPSCPSGTERTNVTVSVSVCDGINSNTIGNSQVSVYPNPNQGNMIIDLVKKGDVVVTDLYGKVVIETSLEAGKNQIDLKDYASGIYFFQLKDNKAVTFKIIKE